MLPVVILSLLVGGITIAIAKLFKDGNFYIGTLGILISQILFLSIFYALLEKHYTHIKTLYKEILIFREHLLKIENQFMEHLHLFHEDEIPESELESLSIHPIHLN